MPLHDWTPERDWIFWDFRLSWLIELSHALNAGRLPSGYFTMIDVKHPYRNDRPERRITVNTGTPRTIVATVEIVNPRDVERPIRVEMLAGRVAFPLRDGIGVTVIDVLPPGLHNPSGVVAVVRARLGIGWGAAPTCPLTSAGYKPGSPVEEHPVQATVGQPLPDVPLYLPGGVCVLLPLEETYAAVYARKPAELKAELE